MKHLLVWEKMSWRRVRSRAMGHMRRRQKRRKVSTACSGLQEIKADDEWVWCEHTTIYRRNRHIHDVLWEVSVCEEAPCWASRRVAKTKSTSKALKKLTEKRIGLRFLVRAQSKKKKAGCMAYLPPCSNQMAMGWPATSQKLRRALNSLRQNVISPGSVPTEYSSKSRGSMVSSVCRILLVWPGSG